MLEHLSKLCRYVFYTRSTSDAEYTYFHNFPRDLLSSEFCRCGYCLDMTRRAACAHTMNAFIGRLIWSFFRSDGDLEKKKWRKKKHVYLIWSSWLESFLEIFYFDFLYGATNICLIWDVCFNYFYLNFELKITSTGMVGLAYEIAIFGKAIS